MNILRRLAASCTKPAKTHRSRPTSHFRFPFRCGLETLEQRLPMAAYVVNSLADGAPVADGLLTLREAITAANTNAASGDAPAGNATLDTIRFDISTHYGTINLNAAAGALSIAGGGDLSIIGPDTASPAGIVISAQNAVRGFIILSSTNRITIENLTVTRGNAPGGGDSGGGIVNTGLNTTLRNVAVTASTAAFGGGVANLGSVTSLAGLTMIDSVISGNRAGVSLGGGGGGIYNFVGTLTVIGSEISGNSSLNQGGGLVNQSAAMPGTALTIIDSLVAGNHAAADGGGIASSDTLTVEGSTIAGNTTALSAGGVYISNSSASIVNSTIVGNLSEGLGGGIRTIVATVTIINATIVANSDTSDSPSNGASAGGIAALPMDTIDLINSIVARNTAVAGREDNVELGDLDTNVNNFIGGDPILGPLKDNGGPTPTMLPLPGSPVIDAGSDAPLRFGGVITDQRGLSRIVDGDGNQIRAVDIGAVEVTPLPAPLVVAADAGGGPHVKVFLPDGSLRFSFFAYDPGFAGGVRVATGDVSGDGVADIITAPGPGGGPHIKVFSGANGALIRSFFAYNAGFTGGVYVAAGDVNGDSLADIITGAGPGGGPHVRVFSGNGGDQLASFFAYDAGFGGGVRVATGDLDGDDRADLITAAGPGGGPHVKAFSGANAAMVLRSFFAFDSAFTGGVYVAAGDTNGDGQIDIIASAGEGGSPQVRVFDGANRSMVLLDFLAYAQNFNGGVRVGAVDRNGDGRADILTAAGPTGGPHVRIFDGLTAAQLDSFFAFEASFAGGMLIS